MFYIALYSIQVCVCSELEAQTQTGHYSCLKFKIESRLLDKQKNSRIGNFLHRSVEFRYLYGKSVISVHIWSPFCTEHVCLGSGKVPVFGHRVSERSSLCFRAQMNGQGEDSKINRNLFSLLGFFFTNLQENIYMLLNS